MEGISWWVGRAEAWFREFARRAAKTCSDVATLDVWLARAATAATAADVLAE